MSKEATGDGRPRSMNESRCLLISVDAFIGKDSVRQGASSGNDRQSPGNRRDLDLECFLILAWTTVIIGWKGCGVADPGMMILTADWAVL
jgi:hypothetical protein